MFRLGYVFVFLIFGLPAMGEVTGETLRPIPEEFAKTCKHYENRARFKVHDGNAELSRILADSCDEAIRDAYVKLDATPYGTRRATAFLKRLTELRETITQMNMELMFNTPRPTGSGPTAVRSVSRVGEYLIARELGVVRAYYDWAFATGYRSAALN